MQLYAIGCTRTGAISRIGSVSIKPISRFFPAAVQITQPICHQQAFQRSRRTFSTTQTSYAPRNTTRIPSRTLATSSTPTIASPNTSTASPSTLSWNDYLALRQKRRYYNLGASIITGVASFAGGISFLMSQDLDKLSSILFGLDPVMAMGLASLGFGTLGWLAGPFAGEALFRLSYRQVMAQMATKERNFYQRIKKNRCDPSAQSVSNPVPDYYGEKIASVQGYRQWLKDQRAFRKKREMPTF